MNKKISRLQEKNKTNQYNFGVRSRGQIQREVKISILILCIVQLGMDTECMNLHLLGKDNCQILQNLLCCYHLEIVSRLQWSRWSNKHYHLKNKTEFWDWPSKKKKKNPKNNKLREILTVILIKNRKVNWRKKGLFPRREYRTIILSY